MFKLSNQQFDELYGLETLYKLGGISKDLFEYGLNEFSKKNLTSHHLGNEQSL
jgi:hypothetical protein